MKIIINGVEFENARWYVENGIGKMSFESDDSIIEILEEIGENQDVFVYDDEETLVSKWNNYGVIGINAQNGRVSVDMNVSILDENTEEQLQTGIDESVDAIIELAEMIADIEGEVSEITGEIADVKEDVDKISEDITAVKNATEAIPNIQENVTGLQTGLNNLQNRMDGIPNDIIERFTAIWSNYNALADRVARLENKEG